MITIIHKSIIVLRNIQYIYIFLLNKSINKLFCPFILFENPINIVSNDLILYKYNSANKI